jgi:hypothetical protein
MPCRLKATLERAQRLTQGFTDSLLEVLPGMADSLGNALGIEQERQKVRGVKVLHMPSGSLAVRALSKISIWCRQ